jgi:peroxiredoxin
VQGAWDKIRQAGGEALLVVQAAPKLLAAHLQRRPLPFPAVADPSRAAYRAFGLERTSWARMLRPGVVFGYLRLIFRGWRPRLPSGAEDVLQLGGDFVLDAEGRLRYAHRSADPMDRPGVDVLLGAIRAAAERTPKPACGD